MTGVAACLFRFQDLCPRGAQVFPCRGRRTRRPPPSCGVLNMRSWRSSWAPISAALQESLGRRAAGGAGREGLDDRSGLRRPPGGLYCPPPGGRPRAAARRGHRRQGRRRDLHLKGSGPPGSRGAATAGPRSARCCASTYRRGHARPWHPDHAGARGGRHGRAGAPGRALPVRCSPGLPRAICAWARSSTLPRPATGTCCAHWPTTPSPVTTRRPPTARIATWTCTGGWLGRRRRWWPGDAGRVRPRGDEHRQPTISGETIDYGPCAFMDAFDPATVFSSIDDQAATPMATSRGSCSGTWPGWLRPCCLCSTTTATPRLRRPRRC